MNEILTITANRASMIHTSMLQENVTIFLFFLLSTKFLSVAGILRFLQKTQILMQQYGTITIKKLYWTTNNHLSKLKRFLNASASLELTLHISQDVDMVQYNFAYQQPLCLLAIKVYHTSYSCESHHTSNNNVLCIETREQSVSVPLQLQQQMSAHTGKNL